MRREKEVGLYDTYGATQLKAGDPYLKDYKEGEEVEIPDGIYWGYYGFVVIKNGIFVGEFKRIFNNSGTVRLNAHDDIHKIREGK